MKFQFPVNVWDLGPAGPQPLEAALVPRDVRDKVVNHFEDLEVPSPGRPDEGELALPKPCLDLHRFDQLLPARCNGSGHIPFKIVADIDQMGGTDRQRLVQPCLVHRLLHEVEKAVPHLDERESEPALLGFNEFVQNYFVAQSAMELQFLVQMSHFHADGPKSDQHPVPSFADFHP